MPSRWRQPLAELGWPIGISIALLMLWEIAVRTLGIRSIILPPPSEIIAAVIALSLIHI